MKTSRYIVEIDGKFVRSYKKIVMAAAYADGRHDEGHSAYVLDSEEGYAEMYRNGSRIAPEERMKMKSVMAYQQADGSFVAHVERNDGEFEQMPLSPYIVTAEGVRRWFEGQQEVHGYEGCELYIEMAGR